MEKRSKPTKSRTRGPFEAFEAFGAFADLREVHSEALSQLTPERLKKLASELGVSPDSLRQIGAGWRGGGWTFPEQDSHGNIVGLATRTLTGKKKCVTGSRRSLVVPANLRELPDPVLLVEGPSDVAACLTLGLAAVGRPTAAGGADAAAAVLAGREVLVVGENDRKPAGKWPGREGATGVASSLANQWSTPVNWTLPPNGVKDVRAWLNQRIKAGEVRLDDPASCQRAGQVLIALLRRAAIATDPTEGLIMLNLAEVEPQDLKWLWENRIPEGMLVVLAGDPELGKSTIAAFIASNLTRGRAWADGAPAPEPARVIWLNAEDDTSRVLVHKLRAAGADMRAVHVLDGVRDESGVARPFSLDVDLRRLEQYLRVNPKVKLVVVDPITSYMGDVDGNSAHEVRAVLSPLKDLCEKFGVTVLAITHFNKSVGANPIYRVTGSLALAAAARTLWIVCTDPKDRSRRLFLCGKMNVAPKPLGLQYHIDGLPPVVTWKQGAVNVTAADALAHADTTDEATRDPCVQWLRELLEGGRVGSDEVAEMAVAAGFTKPELVRAKAALGVRVRKGGFKDGWFWMLPKEPEDREGSEDREDGEGGSPSEHATSSGVTPSP